MKSIAPVLLCVLTLSSSPAQAQLAPPDGNGLAMGHLHFGAKDVEGMNKFFVTLGGVPTQIRRDLIEFPGVFVIVRQADPPSTGGTAGSTVNHIGFNVKNMQESRARWEAAGMQWEPNGRPTQGYLVGPEGIRVEIIEDKAIATPIKFHHIHFFSEAAPADLQAWYVKTFGAIAGKRANFDAADLPGVNLTFSKSDTPVVGTRGRSLDHIGFDIKDLEQFTKTLEARGVKFDRPYSKVAKPTTTTATAFLTDPWGTYVELTEDIAPAK